MATYDFYKYFDTVQVDLRDIVKKYNLIYPNEQDTVYNIRNLFNLMNLNRNIISNIEQYFDNYIIVNDERPDIIAYKLYEDVNLWWLNLYINNISYFDFPLSDKSLYQLANELYYNEYKYSLEKYVEILTQQNEKKRNIKVVKPNQINLVLTTLFNGFAVRV